MVSNEMSNVEKCVDSRHATDELGQVAGGCDSGTAAEGLELDIGDGVGLGVDADVEPATNLLALGLTEMKDIYRMAVG